MKRLLDGDNLFWRCVGRVADWFLLSMTWMACCLPLITAGAAAVALYDAVSHCIRGGEDNMIRRYFAAFRRELLRSIPLTLLWGVLGYALLVGFGIVSQLAQEDPVWLAFRLVYVLTLTVPAGLLCWCVAVRAKLGCSFRKLHAAAARYAMAELPRTLVAVALVAAALAAAYFVPYLLLFLPAALAQGVSWLLDPVLAEAAGSGEIE